MVQLVVSSHDGAVRVGGGEGGQSARLDERLEGHDLVVEQLLELVLVQLLVCGGPVSERPGGKGGERGETLTIKLEILRVERGHRGLVLRVVLFGANARRNKGGRSAA